MRWQKRGKLRHGYFVGEKLVRVVAGLVCQLGGVG